MYPHAPSAALELISERLQALLKDEKETPEGFIRLPRKFIEISKVLLDL